MPCTLMENQPPANSRKNAIQCPRGEMINEKDAKVEETLSTSAKNPDA